MDEILLVSGTQKSSETLTSLLAETASVRITTVSTGKAARAAMNSHPYAAVVINTPLGDEFGHDLALEALDEGSGSLLLVRKENFESVYDQVGSMGVCVVAKPVNKTFFSQSVRMALSLHRRLSGLKEKNEKLQRQLEEMRLIDRAKCALIQYVKMTEPQAHRYIEKHAMDLRISRKEVALTILKTYES